MKRSHASGILERSTSGLAAAQAVAEVRLSTAQVQLEAGGAPPAEVVISNCGAAAAVFSICAAPAKVRCKTESAHCGTPSLNCSCA